MRKTNILVVVDMQNDFISGSLGSDMAKEIVPNVVDKINNFNGHIIATRDTHTNDYLSTHEGKLLPIEHCIRDTDGWKIESTVLDALNETNDYSLIDKNQFGDTGKLPQFIKNLWQYDGDLSITLIGLCTDICVVSNALILRAAFPEADIAVDPLCCAGVTIERHNAALTTMEACQIEIINNS